RTSTSKRVRRWPNRSRRADSTFAMTDLAVAVEGLTKVFPIPFRRQSIVAVRDLNLRVEPGEIYGLLGPNGSGKTTTLKIILGLASPTRGQTKIFGRDSALVASRESVGFLPENPYFYKFLTGEETLRADRRTTERKSWPTARACRPNECASSTLEDLFKRNAPTNRSRPGAD